MVSQLHCCLVCMKCKERMYIFASTVCFSKFPSSFYVLKTSIDKERCSNIIAEDVATNSLALDCRNLFMPDEAAEPAEFELWMLKLAIGWCLVQAQYSDRTCLLP